MTKPRPNGKTDALVAEAQRIQQVLVAAVGELSAFVQQLNALTEETREEGHDDR